MELGQSFTDNLEQAEEWIVRLRSWAERVETYPTMLGMISVLKYIPSNGAQAARRKLEDYLKEKPTLEETENFTGESENDEETYELKLDSDGGKLSVDTRSGHSIEITADEETLEIEHGEDPSNIFYPRMKERVSKTFGIDWVDKQVEIETKQAIHQLFKSELDRARSTLRWAIQEHQKAEI